MVENLVLRRCVRGAVNSERISLYDIPPQIKILNTVIPILMHFCSFVSNWSIASRIKPDFISSYHNRIFDLRAGAGASSTSVGPFPGNWLAARIAGLTPDLQVLLS